MDVQRLAADGLLSAEQTARGISVGFDTLIGDADQPVDGLMSGRSWDRTDLTFSFPNSASDYGTNYIESNAQSGFVSFTNVQKNAARDALDTFASVSGLTFTELTGNADGNADLRAAMSTQASTAFAYYPYTNDVGGDSFYNTRSFNSPEVGNYAYFTMLHEYGHALGLKHGHEANGPGAVPLEWDSSEFTVMTYRSYVGKSTSYGLANEQFGFAQSLMMLDIAAIQRLYGANFEENAGDTVYSFSTSSGAFFVDGVEVARPGANRVFRTIWDGDGEDTYDFSNYATDLGVDLAPGGYVDLDTGGLFQRAALENGYQGNFAYARGHVFNALQFEGDARSLIENANGGSGNDSFWGNAADNTFRGNGGNDTFYDSAGADTYYGGAGNDVVRFAGEVAGYTIEYVAGFLEVDGEAVDRVEETVEQLIFGTETFSFADFKDVQLPPPPPPPNAAPDARDDAFSVDEAAVLANISLLANDADPEEGALSIVEIDGRAVAIGQSVTLSSGARVTLNADGTVTYRQNGVFDGLTAGETGTERFTYTIADPEGARDTANVTIDIAGSGTADTGLPDSEPAAFKLNINAGGSGFTDASGTVWLDDAAYLLRGRAAVKRGAAEENDPSAKIYDSVSFGADLDYGIDIENGLYDVVLKFSEVYFQSTGRRVFDASVEGQKVVDDLDIYARTGTLFAPYDVVIEDVAVRDGRLDLDFQSEANFASLSGVVVERVGDVLPDTTVNPDALYVNGGGATFTDASGITWESDAAYRISGRTAIRRGDAEDGDASAKVYDSVSFAADLGYEIALDNGTYDLVLKFSEVYFQGDGRRVFDVSVEGDRVIDDLDIFARTGSRFESYDVVLEDVIVADGVLDIDFNASIDNASLSGLVVVQDGMLPETDVGTGDMYINAGGSGFSAADGTSWTSDRAFLVQGRASINNGDARDGDPESKVYGSVSFGQDLAYDIDVADGTYDIVLKFSEVYFQSAGRRVFDVAVEGVDVLDDLDIYDRTGARFEAYDVLLSSVDVTDGTLDIDFSSEVNFASLAGLEIRQAGPAIDDLMDVDALAFADDAIDVAGLPLDDRDRSAGESSADREYDMVIDFAALASVEFSSNDLLI